MRKSRLIDIVFLVLVLFFVSSTLVSAQNEGVIQEEVSKARVMEIVDQGTNTIDVYGKTHTYPFQIVKVKILSGSDVGKEILIDHGKSSSISESLLVEDNQEVVVFKTTLDGQSQYSIRDKYRLNNIIIIALLFVTLVVLLSRLRSIGSFMGLACTFVVIIMYIVPQILAGKDPLLVSIIGSICILVSSIYLAHGFSKQTTVAVVSTAFTLILTGILSILFVNNTNLTGTASEDAYALQFGSTSKINFKGLLLGGMIIGFLGVLDDVTTSLAATVFELKKLNPLIKTKALIQSSLNIGREHISSLVNTLVLAYAGTSLPLFLFIVLNPQNYPAWAVVNSEFLAEEIVRTLSGSIGLLLAVPITIGIATWFVSRDKPYQKVKTHMLRS